MRKLILSFLFLCAVSVNLLAQPVSYDPCGELRVALFTADKLISQGKLDEALEKLNKFKNDPEMRNCEEIKEGMVDFKIDDVKKRIAERDVQKSPEPPSYKSSCPDGKHPHMIDLGLPSGTKWACCNVDAKTPEDYGGYYAWGETTTKSEYTKENYFYKKNKTGTQFQDLGASICGTQYDVAHVKWGGSWQLPTKDQIKELLDKCNEGEWTTQNGVEGRKFTGPNGRSIFLPAAGYRRDAGLVNVGNSGYYWSGMQQTNEHFAYGLGFSSPGAGWNAYHDRYDGYRVRPVAR